MQLPNETLRKCARADHSDRVKLMGCLLSSFIQKKRKPKNVPQLKKPDFGKKTNVNHGMFYVKATFW